MPRKTISPKRLRSSCGSSLIASKPRPSTNSGTSTPPPAQPGHDFRHIDEGMVAVGTGEGALVLGLVLVVELLHDPFAQLVGDRLGVEPGRDRPRQAHQRAGVAEVGLE